MKQKPVRALRESTLVSSS